MNQSLAQLNVHMRAFADSTVTFASLNGVGVTDRSLFWGSVVLCYCSRAHGIKFPVRGGQAAASSSNQGDGHPLGLEL